MTDGVRMPRSYAFRTTTFDREYLSLELLKRIEVVRGPASALYGSDGMAGLVNFITHEPADFLVSKEGDAPKPWAGALLRDGAATTTAIRWRAPWRARPATACSGC